MDKHDRSNIIGNILTWIGIIASVLSLIGTLFLSTSWLTATLLGLLVAGVGQVINLLQKIYANTKVLNKEFYRKLEIEEAKEEEQLESMKITNVMNKE